MMAANVLVPLMSESAAQRTFTPMSLRHVNVDLQPNMTGMTVPSQIEFQFMTLTVDPEEEPDEIRNDSSKRRLESVKKRKTTSRIDFSSKDTSPTTFASTTNAVPQKTWATTTASLPTQHKLGTNDTSTLVTLTQKAAPVRQPSDGSHRPAPVPRHGYGYGGDDQLSQISQSSQITTIFQTIDSKVSVLTASIERNSSRITDSQAHSARAQENHRIEMAKMQAQIVAQNEIIMTLLQAQQPTRITAYTPRHNDTNLSMTFDLQDGSEHQSIDSVTGLNTTLDDMDLDIPQDSRTTKRDKATLSNLDKSPAKKNHRPAESRTNTRLEAPLPQDSAPRARNNSGRRQGS
jgi:hypothetical protein